jgi:CHAD domain-containing protein
MNKQGGRVLGVVPLGAIVAATPPDVAAHILIRACYDLAFASRDSVLRGDDARAIRDTHLAVRRLRTALWTFRRAYPKGRARVMGEALHRVARPLAIVRVADVSLAVLRSTLGGTSARERPGVTAALDVVRERRRNALGSLAIELSQFDRTPHDARSRMRERTIAKFLARAVRRSAERVDDLGALALSRARRGDLRRLQLALERLGHELEFARALAPEPVAVALNRLAFLEEPLVSLADLDGFERSYDALLATLNSQDERRPGIESLRASARRGRELALAKVRAAWPDGGSDQALAASISAAVGSLSPNDA